MTEVDAPPTWADLRRLAAKVQRLEEEMVRIINDHSRLVQRVEDIRHFNRLGDGS